MTEPRAARPRRIDLSLSSADPDALERYRAAHADFFEPELDPAGFEGRFEKFDLGEAVLGRSRTVGQTFRRTRQHTRRNGVDHVMLLWSARGDWAGDYDGRSSEGGLGTVRLVDLDRPFANVSTSYDAISLTLPRKALGADWERRDLHGVVLAETTPGARLLTAHLRTLYETAETLTGAEAAAGARAAGMLVTGALHGHLTLVPEVRPAIERTLLGLAQSHIRQNLFSAALTPAAISTHLRISPRSLYRIFESIGGVAAFIQAERLDRAYDALAAEPRLSVAAIAYAHGFQSDAHFSRAFLGRFGIRPGELRGRGIMAGEPVTAVSGGSAFGKTLLDWFQRL